jgi:DNA-directed RNA polymerase subunit RPC12/RpoP
MSEFKYACPVCGQHIKCDSSQSGTVMECPTCFQKITVPQAPATADPKLIITGSKVGGERPLPSTGDLGGLAPRAKNSPVAAILLLVLLCGLAAAAIVYRGKIFQLTNHQQPAASQTNPATTAQTTAPPPAKQVTPAPNTALIAPPANDTNWTLELGAAVIPDATAAGRIHGINFITAHATLEGGTLTLRWPLHGTPAQSVSVYLHANQGEDLAGQSVSIPDNFTNAPRVRLRWNGDQPTKASRDFRGGYALKIDFGELAGNRLPGKIYLSTPDDEKSYVAGTFNAEIHHPAPKQ